MLATLPAARSSTGKDAVARAMAAAGGRDLLSRVRVLSWSGTSRMLLGNVAVDLIVETRIEPFLRGRFDSWLASEGRISARTVMIERNGGFIVHEGAQTSLLPGQARFELQQLGAYGYLLLAPAFVTAAGGNRLHATRDGFPPIALTLGSTGRIASADYAIAAPGPRNVSVRQHLTLADTVSDNGVHFPRTIAITQNGRPLSRTTITDFSVELAPA